MKKLLIILLLTCCVGPAFAQGILKVGGNLPLSAKIAREVLKTEQRMYVARQLAQARAVVPIEIRIFDDKPSFPARMALEDTFPEVDLSSPLSVTPDLTMGYLHRPKAEALVAYLLGNNLKHGDLLYRGIGVSDVESVKNILFNGMEINKSKYDEIFLARQPWAAVNYAHLPLPVLAVMPANVLPFENATEHPDKRNLIQAVSFAQDIKADMIRDLLVFLDVNGWKGWYKVVLDEEGGLLFLPMPVNPVSIEK